MNTKQTFDAIEVEAADVERWMDDHEAVLVDVRETAEYEQEHITGSVLVPLSVFDANRFPRITGKKVVMHCAVGKRSAAAGKQLLQADHSQIYNLRGGIQAWKEAGLATEVQFVPPTVPDDIPLSAKDRRNLESAATSDYWEGVSPHHLHPGEVLLKEFLEPLDISASRLAGDIGVEAKLIDAMLRGESAMTMDTALRLSRYFSTSEAFWLRLQMDYELAKASASTGARVEREVKPRRSNPSD